MKKKPLTSTGIRFDPELYKKLQIAAEERHLSVNYLVNKAVEDLLPRLIPANELKLTKE